MWLALLKLETSLHATSSPMLGFFRSFSNLDFSFSWPLVLIALVSTVVLHLLYKQVREILYRHKIFAGYVVISSIYFPFLAFFWGHIMIRGYIFYLLDNDASVLLNAYDMRMMRQLLRLALGIACSMRFVNVMGEVLKLHYLPKIRLQAYLVRFGVRIVNMGLFTLFVFLAIQVLQLPISAKLWSVGVVVVAWMFTLIGIYFLYALNKNITRKMRIKERFLLGSAVLKKLILPIIFLLFSVTSLFSMQEVGLTPLVSYVGYKEVLQISFFWFLFRITSLFEGQLLSDSFSRTTSNKTMVQAAGNFTRVGLGFILVLVLMNKMGYNANAIITLLGGASLGLSFAGKDIVANYLSGIVIYFEGQFSVGDWVYPVDKSFEGTIEYIGIRTTSIRTFDKRLLLVPNSFFSSRGIINASKMTNRRILKEVPLGWLNDVDVLEKIVQDVRLLVYNHPGIDKVLPPMVHFTDFGTSDLTITIYALTRTKNWHTFMNVQESILREVKSIIEKYGGTPPIEFLQVKEDLV